MMTPVPTAPADVDRDGTFRIDVTDDKMRATLYLAKASGAGRPLDLKALGAALRESKLKGMDVARIQADVLEFTRDAGRAELCDYLLVEGKPAGGSLTTKVRYQVPSLASSEVARLKAAAASAAIDAFAGVRSLRDFPIEAAQHMAFVEHGHAVAVVEQSGKLTEGYDVYGTRLMPADAGRGADAAVRMLENVKRERSSYVATVDGLFEATEVDGVHFLRVRPHRDGDVTVRVSSDKMEAALSLRPHEGTGLPINRESVNDALRAEGVAYGVDQAALADAISRAALGQVVDGIPIARGVSPQSTGQSRIRFLIELASGREVTIDARGRANYRNQDRITTVQGGVAFAQLLPPDAKPADGTDVTGKKVPAKSAAPLAIEIGANIRREPQPDGSVTLVATQSGELTYDKNRIEIKSIHQVSGSVDYKSGNVKFPGSVEIRGGVLGGFYVISGGDIRVTEGVEASLLSADGSIYLVGGVKGGGHAALRARHDIRCTFAEQALLMAVGDIRIKNGCVRCDIKCNGQFVLESERGSLIGGRVRAQHGVDVMTLGSESGVRTEVSFGQDYVVGDQIEKEESEIRACKEAIMKVEGILARHEHSSDQSAIEAARAEKVRLLKIVEKRGMRVFTLREAFEHHFDAMVRVRGTIHPGVVLESHGRTLEIKTAQKGVVFAFDAHLGHIHEVEPKK